MTHELRFIVLGFIVLALALTSSPLVSAQTPAAGPTAPTGASSPALPSGEAAPPGPAAPEVAPLADTLTGQAKAEYAAARILYDDGDYAGALTKLQVAHRLSGDPRLLWNMAAAEKNLRHYAQVIRLLRQYLATESPFITALDREQAQTLLATVQGFVADVTFDVQPEGASVLVDNMEIGKAPIVGPVPIDFGRRALRVERAGYESHQQTLELEGGKAVALAVRLIPMVNQGTLRVMTDPRTTIRIDGRVMGVGLWEGTLPSGAHAVQLEGQGKISQTTEVAIQNGETRTLNIQLRDESARDRSKVPMWVWVGGGVVAAAALGTGAYFVFREDEEAPPVQEGTWGTLEF